MGAYQKATPATVEVVMGETGIKNHRLAHALLERGHGSADIEKMSPRERLDEFLTWEGIEGWTDTILETAKAAGFVVGERREAMSITNEIRDYLGGVVGVVEATREEQSSLWCNYAEEGAQWGRQKGNRYPWQSTGAGFLSQVGEIGEMQVWVSLMTAVVNDHKLLFYYSSGRYSDSVMIEEWLRRFLPDTAKGNFPGGYNHTDATNFCNIFRRL